MGSRSGPFASSGRPAPPTCARPPTWPRRWPPTASSTTRRRPVVAAPDPDAWGLARAAAGARDVAGPRRSSRSGRRPRALAALWRVTLRLRRDCPWDREQTIGSIVPHTIEEAYEVAEKALAGPADAGLIDELGDLLFQTYFLAMLAREDGRRRPRRRGGRDPDEAGPPPPARVRRRGAATTPPRCSTGGSGSSASRRAARASSTTSRARCRACCTPARCSAAPPRSASTGQRYADAWPAIGEEVDELAAALARTAPRAPSPPPEVLHEAGDVLFAVVNVLRLAGVDPELAVRAAAPPVPAPRRGRGGARRARWAAISDCSGWTSRTATIDAPRTSERDHA